MRRWLTLWGTLCLVSVVVPVQAAPRARPEVPVSQLDLADLESLGSFTVTLSGTAEPSFPEGKPSLYAETVYGERQGEAWSYWTQIGHSQAPIVVHTPRGELSLTPNRLRLHLSPDYARRYRPDQAAEAPEVMRDDLRASDKPLEIVTYTLQQGRTYHAKVDREGYYLPPPRDGAPPERRFNRVLLLSDVPFADGRPAKPATPHSGSIVY